jgi:hypothetical protein
MPQLPPQRSYPRQTPPATPDSREPRHPSPSISYRASVRHAAAAFCWRPASQWGRVPFSPKTTPDGTRSSGIIASPAGMPRLGYCHRILAAPCENEKRARQRRQEQGETQPQATDQGFAPGPAENLHVPADRLEWSHLLHDQHHEIRDHRPGRPQNGTGQAADLSDLPRADIVTQTLPWGRPPEPRSALWTASGFPLGVHAGQQDAIRVQLMGQRSIGLAICPVAFLDVSQGQVRCIQGFEAWSVFPSNASRTCANP